jgi:hypothetical protein
MRMIKQATTKEDGRILTFYWFTKKPLEVQSQKSKVEGKKDDRPQS